MSSSLPTPIPGTPVPHSNTFPATKIFDQKRFHYRTKALFMPTYFHGYIHPTIRENSSLAMEPLNWEFGVRCDRPFSNVRAIHPKPLPSLKRMSVPTGQDVPTKYFLDQQKFWEAEPGDDPNPHPNDLDDHLVESEPLQFWWEALTALLEVVWLFGSAILLLFWNVLKMMVPLVVVSWQWIADRVGWEAIVALLMASQAMSFLPGFDRTIGRADMGGEAWKSSAPLYVIMIPNFHQMTRAAVPVSG